MQSLRAEAKVFARSTLIAVAILLTAVLGYLVYNEVYFPRTPFHSHSISPNLVPPACYPDCTPTPLSTPVFNP